MDAIKSSDWIIDIGPEGDNGGRVVATGSPDEIAKKKFSH